MARKEGTGARRLFPQLFEEPGTAGPSTPFPARTGVGVPVATPGRVRARISPIIRRRLGPALARAIEAQLGRPGATGEGILRGLETTGGFEISRELSGLQLAGEQVAAGQVPSGPSVGEGAIGGAIEGAVAGGPIGAVAGGVGGAISAQGGKKRERKQRKGQEQAAAAAQIDASAEQFGTRTGELEGLAREQALVSGAGAQRAQALETAITASGLRDTGLGTLASISAGVQQPLEELERSFGLALNETRRIVAARLGTPIPSEQRKPDRVAQGLEALASLLLTRGERTTEGGGASKDPVLLPPPVSPDVEGIPGFPGSDEGGIF